MSLVALPMTFTCSYQELGMPDDLMRAWLVTEGGGALVHCLDSNGKKQWASLAWKWPKK